MKVSHLAFAALLCMPVLSFAHEAHKAPEMPAGFDKLKSLVGTWEGTANMEGKDMPVKTVFEVTSGGSVITEKMGPGTEHEMINMYHADGKRLSMTHYCASGNQPHMMLKKSDDKSLAFEMEKPIGVSSMKESHMHSVTLTMLDPDTLEAKWMNMENGKMEGPTVFKYKRKK